MINALIMAVPSGFSGLPITPSFSFTLFKNIKFYANFTCFLETACFSTKSWVCPCCSEVPLFWNNPDPVLPMTSSGFVCVADSAHGLFGHAASLVCNRLMATWKVELNIALAAIEVLSGLAKVRLATPNLLMGKRTVNWVCEFIVYQCSRPAPAHSKDLHSMIVAAFHCLSLWLVEHDYLMTDRECLHCVLEVVELGISGSKSQVSDADIRNLDLFLYKDLHSDGFVQTWSNSSV